MTNTNNKNVMVGDHEESLRDLANLLFNKDGSKRCMIGEVMHIVNSEKYSDDQIINWILQSAKNFRIPRETFIAQFNAFKELKLYLDCLTSEDQEKWMGLLFSKTYVLPRSSGWALIFGTQKHPELCINVFLSFMSNTGGRKVLSLNDKYNTRSQTSKKLLTSNNKGKKSYLSCHQCKINRVSYLKSIKRIKFMYELKMQKFLAPSRNKPKKMKLLMNSVASNSILSRKYNEIQSQIFTRMRVRQYLQDMMKRMKERSLSPKNHSKRGRCDGQATPFFTLDKSLSNVRSNCSFLSNDGKVSKDIELRLRQDAATCLELPEKMLKIGEPDYKFSCKSDSIQTDNFNILNRTNIYWNIPSNIGDSPRTFSNTVGAFKITCKRLLESNCSEGQLTKKSKFLSYSYNSNEEAMANKSELWFCERKGRELVSAMKYDVGNIPNDKTPQQKKKVSFSLKNKISFEERQNPLLSYANNPLSSSNKKKNEMSLKSSQPPMHFINNKTTNMPDHLDEYYCKEKFGYDNTSLKNNNLTRATTLLNSKNSKGKVNILSGKHSDSFIPIKHVHFSDNIRKKKLSSKKTCKAEDLSLQLRMKKLPPAEYNNINKQGKSYFPREKIKKSHEKDNKESCSKEQINVSHKLVTQSIVPSNSSLHDDSEERNYKSKQGPRSEIDGSSWDLIWSPLKKELKSLLSLVSKQPCYSKLFARSLKKCEGLYLNLDEFLYEKEFTLNLYKREVIALQHNLFFLEDILKDEYSKFKYQDNGECPSLKDCVADEVDKHSSFHCYEKKNLISLSDYQHSNSSMSKSCGNTKVTKSKISGSPLKRMHKNVYSHISNNHQTVDLSYKLDIHNEHYVLDEEIHGCKPFQKETQLLPSDKDATLIDNTIIGEIEHLQMLDLLNEREKLTQRLNKYHLLISSITQANNSVRKFLGLKGEVDLFNNPSLKDEVRNLKRLVNDQRHLQYGLKDCEEKLNSKLEEITQLKQKLITVVNQNLLAEHEGQILKEKLNEVEIECKEVKQTLSEKEAQLFHNDSSIKCEVEHQKLEIAKYKKEIKKLILEQSNFQLCICHVNQANTAIEECLSLHCSNYASKEITFHDENLLNAERNLNESMKVEIFKENQKASQKECQEAWLLLAENFIELDENGTGKTKIQILKEQLIVFDDNLRMLLHNHKVLISNISKVTGILAQWFCIGNSNGIFDLSFLKEEIIAINLHFEDWHQQKHFIKTLQEKLNDMQREILDAKETILSGTLSKNMLEQELLVLKNKHKELLLEKEADSKEKALLIQERELEESQILGKKKELQSLSEQLDKYKLIVASFTKGNNEIRECLGLPSNVSLLCNPSQIDEVAKLKNIYNDLSHQKSLVIILEEKLLTQKNETTLFERKLEYEIDKHISVEKELLLYKDGCIKLENESSLQIIEIHNLKGEVEKIKSIIARITNACYAIREYLGLQSAVDLYEDPSLSEEISELKQIMVYHKNNLKTMSVKKQQINKLISNVHGVNKSKSIIKIQANKQVKSKILLLKNNQLSLKNEIKMLNISQLNCNVSKRHVDHSSSNENLMLETAMLKEKNSALQNSLAEEKDININLNLEITELKNKVAELSSLLKQEYSETSRQLELQLAMYCATADRYREQMYRIEESLNAT